MQASSVKFPKTMCYQISAPRIFLGQVIASPDLEIVAVPVYRLKKNQNRFLNYVSSFRGKILLKAYQEKLHDTNFLLL